MPAFTYTAIDSTSGQDRQGTIESANATAAAQALKARGLFPTSLHPTAPDAPPPAPPAVPRRTPASAKTTPAATAARPTTGTRRAATFPFRRRISAAQRTLFTRQLATLINAGLPILRALETLARQERTPVFRTVIDSIAETIRAGGTLSDGLLQHPTVFDRLYLNMVKAGEAGGVLGPVLDRLAKFMEKSQRIKGKVAAAMTYPVIIVVVATGIVSALMVFVIPKFQTIFAGLLKGQPLPPLTAAVLSLSHFIQDHLGLCLGAVAATIAAYATIRRTPAGIRTTDWLLLRAPGFGPLVLKAAVARFARTFGTLLASGVPILHALRITRDTTGNVHLAGALDQVHDRVKEGETIARPLDATQRFPSMVTSLIEVGEETGDLPEMLTRIADIYDEEVDNAITGLTALIEPILIVLMAFIVGTIVIALFLPILKIIQTLS